MTELPVPIPGLRLFELKLFGDERGFFTERFREDKWPKLAHFVQENHSRSAPRVLRGAELHDVRREGSRRPNFYKVKACRICLSLSNRECFFPQSRR